MKRSRMPKMRLRRVDGWVVGPLFRKGRLGVKDLKLSTRGKVAYASLCAACCGVPMLVLAGLISVGAVVAVGLGFALVVAVVFLACFALRQRSRLVGRWWRALLGSAVRPRRRSDSGCQGRRSAGQ